MLHWLNPPKHKFKKYSDGNGQVSIVADIDPLILPIIDIARRNGMQDTDIELITDEFSAKQISFPQTNDEKFAFIYQIIKVLYEDMNFDDLEQKLFSEIAVEIGLPPEKAMKLITSVYEGLITRATISENKTSFFEILGK